MMMKKKTMKKADKMDKMDKSYSSRSSSKGKGKGGKKMMGVSEKTARSMMKKRK
jgi:hypothetical protein